MPRDIIDEVIRAGKYMKLVACFSMSGNDTQLYLFPALV